MITKLALGKAVKAFCGFIFDTRLGRYAALFALIVSTFSIWLWRHDAKVAAAAKQEVVAEINTKTENLTNEGLKAREGANRVGAWGRLRKHYCRDCD